VDSKVVDVDLGFKAFVKNTHKISGSFTKVGYPHEKDKREGDGKSIAEIAIDNQFGTRAKGGKVHIPARPFFTNATDKNKEKLALLTAKMIVEVQDHVRTPKEALTLLGEFMIGRIRKEITTGNYKENAKVTEKRKGSTKPLIDTGRMRASTTQAIHMKDAL
jgi:phage gpG-like protein